MLTLSRQFQAQVNAYKEYKRLIEREKLMIDASSIVLLDDFMMRCAVPQARRDIYFGKLFRDHDAHIRRMVDNALWEGHIPAFSLSYDQLGEAMQRYMDKKYPVPEPLPEEANQVDGIIRQMRAGNSAAMVVISSRGKVIYETPAKERPYQAVYLGHIIHAVNVCQGKQDALSKREFWAQLRGEGAHVLRFWQDVRDLKDYSGFFPDKPKPQGNDRKKTRQEARAAVWGPVFE